MGLTDAEKRKSRFLNLLLAVLALAVCAAGAYAVQRGMAVKKAQEEVQRMPATKVVLYEGPQSLQDAVPEDLKAAPETARDIRLKRCVDTQVKVEGTDCFVYDTNVNHSRVWSSGYTPALSRTPVAYFDFTGSVEVAVTVPDTLLDSVQISPLSAQIAGTISEDRHTVRFVLDTPGNYTVQFNGMPERALHLFTNPPEEQSFAETDEDVIYIGPGEWIVESINLKDGQTLYLAGGAVLHGIVNANFAKDVTVCGRGILDGSLLEGWKGKSAYVPLSFNSCEGVTVKDVIVLNPNAWAFQGFDSTKLQVDGLRVITPRPNGDGISLQSCKEADIRNCFVRSWDDSLVVKNYAGSSRDIRFAKMQLWTDFAQSMEIGYETNKGQQEDVSITDVSFEEITVLHAFHKPVVSVHNADDALVKDIRFAGITVEDAQLGSGDADEMPYLIDMNITQNQNWSTTRERGRIEEVTIDGLKVLAGKKSPSRFAGYDAAHGISGVHLKNIEILGKRITTAEELEAQVDAKTVSGLTLEQEGQ